MNKENFISAVILGYGKFDETSKKCLDSIIHESKVLGIEIIAIDNGSPDDSAHKLLNYQKEYPHLNIQLNSQNLGFGGGMNEAVAKLNSNWVLLINSDIIFPDQSLKNLINSLMQCPNEIGVVAPLTNNAGNEQCIHIDGSSAEEIIHNSSLIMKNPCRLFTPAYRADFCCVAIRRKLWDQLEGLDRKYGKGYYEDFDFSLRAHKIGYKCAVCEDSFVYHEGSLSFKSNPTQDTLIRKNKLIFLSSHPKAKLLHQRECNWSAIKSYLKHLPNPEINKRLTLRLQLAKKILPKSFLKKLFWSYKIKKLEKFLSSVQS
jgi:GT2 family glycosyltransferase